ncbi:MAG TPA: S41 family peptidase [Gemmatimonadales bacterium]|nr:S41 family peptidase [Gemmatimonadales bacterium]
MRWSFACALLVIALPARVARAPLPGPRGYYTTPAIHGETIVFAAEGDLWTVSTSGGVAQRLTTHPAIEANPAISADGRTLAFTASYEGTNGTAEIYTMPVAGGLPTRRTWDGGRPSFVTWTPDGQVLYATAAYSTLPDAQLVQIDTATGARTVVPLEQASDGNYGPDGTLYFTRWPFQGSHTKRYKGGTVQQIWKYAKGAGEAVPLTADFDGTSKTPMWWQGRIYFVSDRDGTMNLWSMAPDGKDLKQLTHHDGWDIQTPSLDQGKVVYQLGADLWLFDAASGKDQQLDVTLTSDLDQEREKWIATPMDYLTAAHLSPSGDRVVLTARGQVFVAPVAQGRFVEATRKPGVRYRSARFFPDGKALYALSDETGETEWWRLPANGVGAPEQLTSDAKVLRFDGVASPDGQLLAYVDKNQELWLYAVASKKNTRIAASPDGGFGDLSWSPDSKWLAYVAPTQTFSQLMLYSVADGKATAVTDDRVDSYSPAWSADGKWLYFLSDRNFQTLVGAPWGPREPEPFFDHQTRIYGLALQAGLRWPFQAPDELSDAAASPAHDTRKSDAADSTRKAEVQLAGLATRLYQVPVPAGNYGSLSTNGSRLFWLSSATTVEGENSLQALDVSNKAGNDPASIAQSVRSYELSGDGKKLLVRKGQELDVIDASTGPDANLGKGRVDLAGWTFPIDPREEWREMFDEAWRLERDYFYDRHMNGVDWPAMKKKYAPLVDRVASRGDLSDIFGQMIGELSALHMFVYGGDFRKGDAAIAPASLGAVLARDAAAGGYRVVHVFRTDPDYPDAMSPLALPGVNVADGDLIQAINGVSTVSVPDPAELLRNQAGKQVLLRVKPAGGAPARDVVVVPISQGRAFGLRYDEWEYTRRLAVDSASHGAIGYVHLRAMGGGDMAQFERDFYPSFNRQGMIIDVRHNNGGNIDSWVLEKLMRRAWFYWQPNIGNPSWNMQWAFRGHLVVLCDQRTASDGEAFTEGFRRLGLGRVIGARTWGGEIWLSSDNILVDRGIATAAETGVYGPEGQWLIEGHGVDPDTTVDNLPHATFTGRDAQLDAAIQYLQQEIKAHPVPVPAAPRYPDKSVKKP